MPTHRKVSYAKMFLAAPLALFMAVTACNQPAPDTRAADEAALRETDAQWAQAAATRNVDATVAFYTDDAALFPPNAPLANSKEDVRKLWAGLLVPEISLTWKAAKVEVARSGDLGYLTGTYLLSMKDAKGTTANEKGKMVEVWKKQADGKWKCVADIFNADDPAPAPAPAPAEKKK